MNLVGVQIVVHCLTVRQIFFNNPHNEIVRGVIISKFDIKDTINVR